MRLPGSSNLIAPHLVANVHGVSDNSVLPSGFGGQPRAMAMDSTVLGGLEDTSEQQLEVCFSLTSTGLFTWQLVASGRSIIPCIR